ncbi:MAG TPA: hypothetical protein VKK31_20925 [Thermoanaerobaculia bacterium]|nr:hypothetical protein [Thermoanaerobaculia bacterium]
MIRFPTTPAELKEAIAKLSATWLARASKRTEHFRQVGRYDEVSGIWSEIKEVYMGLQHNKCAYCERRLAGPPFGDVEHDVEHFRPKSSVAAWPTPMIAAKRGINYDFATGGAADPGYYLLAYSPFNYVTACKPCNSPLKANYFPIAGARKAAGEDPALQEDEQAFLIYPLGSFDADPEEVLTFDGIIPVPVEKTGTKARRAKVIVDFFELDNREELRRERSNVIVWLWIAHRLVSTGSLADQKIAQKSIRNLTSPASPHTNCARAFVRLIGENPVRAEALATEANDYLDSES